MVTWNTRDISVQRLRELLDIDQGCELRLLVRDNASDDGTADAIRERVPEADLDAGQENLGFAAGVNTLLRRSDADWFFLLNPDASPDPGTIATLVATAERHPDAAAIAPRLEHPDGTLEHSTYPFPSLRVTAYQAFRWPRLDTQQADELMLDGAWMHDRERPVDWAFGTALLMRREAIADVGGLDESFFMYVEDVEWCWRAHKKGWRIWFDPKARVEHVGNVSGKQRYGSRRTATHVRNAYRFFRREHGIASTAVWWLLHVLATSRLLVEALVRRDAHGRRLWSEHLRAHLGSLLPSAHR